MSKEKIDELWDEANRVLQELEIAAEMGDREMTRRMAEDCLIILNDPDALMGRYLRLARRMVRNED